MLLFKCINRAESEVKNIINMPRICFNGSKLDKKISTDFQCIKVLDSLDLTWRLRVSLYNLHGLSATGATAVPPEPQLQCHH